MSHNITHTISCDFLDCVVSETYQHDAVLECHLEEMHWPLDWVFVERRQYFKEKYCPLHPVTVGEQGTITIAEEPDIKVGRF